MNTACKTRMDFVTVRNSVVRSIITSATFLLTQAGFPASRSPSESPRHVAYVVATLYLYKHEAPHSGKRVNSVQLARNLAP